MSLRNLFALTAVLSLTAVAANAGTIISGGSPYGSNSNVTFTYAGVNGPLSGTTKTVKGGNQGYYTWADAKSAIGADWVSAYTNDSDATLAKAVGNLTGDFTYTVTFTSDAAGGIFGSLFSDDYITQINLNGTVYNNPFATSLYNLPGGSPWLNKATLNIDSGVVAGSNTLSFRVNNSGANTAGIAFNLQTAVPEPGEYAAMAMAGLSVCGLMIRARRKKA
jgi:hypothetical protein